MIILGLDTSTSVATVACMKDGIVLGEVSLNNQKTHAEKMMVIVDNLLKLVQVEANEIDYIAVGQGPGSFTGLRIGVTTAKGLAHAWQCQVIEVSSLEALSYRMSNVATVCAMMDARRDTVFTGIYGQHKLEETQCHIDELLENCKTMSEIGFIGDGAYKHKEKIESVLKDKAVLQPSFQGGMSAAAICQLAYEKMNFKNYDQVSVKYLRKTEAERNYENKL
jgi:tRNA threonylcarbamoyladenosine biosynthesis protein TsaB